MSQVNKGLLIVILGLAGLTFLYGYATVQELSAVDCSKAPKDAIVFKTTVGDLTCPQFVDRETLVENFSWCVSGISLIGALFYVVMTKREKPKEISK